MHCVAVELLAPAKVNLTLHVVGRRDNGYHLLDSVVVFADLGDRIRISRTERLSVRTTGPFAAEVPTGGDNLVLRAARLAGVEVAVSLRKELPVGAGIGGGSSDAAAVLRGIAALTGNPPPDPLPLGADLPVCFAAVPSRMRGMGERVEPLPELPPLPMVLVNPGVPVSTGAVFATLPGAYSGPMPDAIPRWRTAAEAAAWLGNQRNDLEPAAMDLVPAIADAQTALAADPACLLARMSGSGSTAFGLFASDGDAGRAAVRLAAEHPFWWVRATRALSGAPGIQESRVTT